MNLSSEIRSKIEDKTGLKIASASSVGGGCINDARRVRFETGEEMLLKTYPGGSGMFIKEANGLMELKKANVLRVPEVIGVDEEYILLEYIESRRGGKGFFEEFGERFAKLHKYEGERFGFFEDNYIGSTVQKNITAGEEGNNWSLFYCNKRLLFQYELAEKNGYVTEELKRAFYKLIDKLPNILEGKEVKPSLLHGDLWSGNYISDEKGEACLIDPAVYYGEREADLAMTKLFGGFSEEFYRSYNETYPLDEGYNYRENIYKLYHVFNHLNLFGRSYYSQTLSLIRYYL